MSESDSSEYLSTSVDSYFDTTPSIISHEPKPYPQRLMHMLADKWNRIKCVKNSPLTSEVETETELLSSSLPATDQEHCTGQCNPLRMNYMLRQRLEQLKIDMASPVEGAAEVTDEQKPTCSGTTSKPDEDMAVAGAVSQPSTSKVSNSMECLMGKKDIRKFIHGNKPTIFLLNFPETKEPLDGESSGTDDSQPSDSWPIHNESRGQMTIYESGRVIISFGEKHFVMCSTPKPGYSQEVVSVERDEKTQICYMTSLGMVEHYVNVLPVHPHQRCQCLLCLEKYANDERRHQNKE